MAKTKQKKIVFTVEFRENEYFRLGLITAFLLCVFFVVSYKITFDDDFFWHLSVGRFIVENKYVPDKDVFGFVTSGTEWIPFEWGWDFLAFGLYKAGGYNAVLVFRSLLFCLIFLLFFHTLKRLKVNTVIASIVLFALLFAMMDRFSPRPHIMSYLFLALTLYIYFPFKYLDRERYFKRLYFLPLIFLVWANMHMGVLAGGLLLFTLVISEIIIYFFPLKFSSAEIKPLTKPHIKSLIIISVICALMLLINPHTYKTYVYTYGHLQMKMMNSIAEWQNPFTGKIEFNFIVTLYKIFLFSGIVVLLYLIVKKDLALFLVLIAFIIHSVRAIRFTVDYEIVMVLFITLSLNYFINKAAEKKSFLIRIIYGNEIKIFFIIFFAITAFYAGNSKIYDLLKYYRISGWGINEDYAPVKVFNFISENNIKGTPFNQYEQGGYLIWILPDQKNFIDSRGLGDEIFDEFNSIFYKYPGYEKKIENHGIDYAIFYEPELVINTIQLKKNVFSFFSTSAEWKLVYWDDKSMLFLKNIPKFSDVIRNNEYKVLNPYNALFNVQGFEELIKNNQQQTKIELERKRNLDPEGYFFKSMSYTASKYVR